MDSTPHCALVGQPKQLSWRQPNSLFAHLKTSAFAPAPPKADHPLSANARQNQSALFAKIISLFRNRKSQGESSNQCDTLILQDGVTSALRLEARTRTMIIIGKINSRSQKCARLGCRNNFKADCPWVARAFKLLLPKYIFCENYLIDYGYSL